MPAVATSEARREDQRMAAGDEAERAWTLGAARAVRAAAQVLEDDGEDLPLSVAQIENALLNFTAANPHETDADLRAEVGQLKDALISRATIEQAKGILMATSKVGPDGAFEVLKHASQRENMKLRDIAARIVADHSTSAP